MEKDDKVFSEHIRQVEELENRFNLAFRKGVDKKKGVDLLTELQRAIDHYPLSLVGAPDLIRKRIESLQERIQNALELRQIEESLKKLELESQFIKVEVDALKNEKNEKVFLKKIADLTVRIHNNNKSINTHQDKLVALEILGSPFTERLETIAKNCNVSRATLFESSLGLIAERFKQVKAAALSKDKLEKIYSFVGYINSNKAQLQREKIEGITDNMGKTVKQDYIRKLDAFVLDAKEYYLEQLKLFHQSEMKKFKEALEDAKKKPLPEESYQAIKSVQAAAKEHKSILESRARPSDQGTELIQGKDIKNELDELQAFSKQIEVEISVKATPKMSEAFLQNNDIEKVFPSLTLEDKIDKLQQAIAFYKNLELLNLKDHANQILLNQILLFIKQAKNAILDEFDEAREEINPETYRNEMKDYHEELSKISRLMRNINKFQSLFFEARKNKATLEKMDKATLNKMGWSQEDVNRVQRLFHDLKEDAQKLSKKTNALRKKMGKGSVGRALKAPFRTRKDPKLKAHRAQSTDDLKYLTEADAMIIELYADSIEQIKSDLKALQLKTIEEITLGDIDELLKSIAVTKDIIRSSTNPALLKGLEQLETQALEQYRRKLFGSIDEKAKEFKDKIDPDLAALKKFLEEQFGNEEQLGKNYEGNINGAERMMQALDKKVEAMIIDKGKLEREKAQYQEKKGILARMKKKSNTEEFMEAGLRKLDIEIRQHVENIHKVKLEFFNIKIKHLEALKQGNPELILSDQHLNPIRTKLAEHKMTLQRLSLGSTFVRQTNEQMQKLEKIATPDSGRPTSHEAMTFLQDVKRRMQFGKEKPTTQAPRAMKLSDIGVRTPAATPAAPAATATPQPQTSRLPSPQPQTSVSSPKTAPPTKNLSQIGKGKSKIQTPQEEGIELRSVGIRTSVEPAPPEATATPQPQTSRLPSPPRKNFSQIKGNFADASFDGITAKSIADNYNETVRIEHKLTIEPVQAVRTGKVDKLMVSLDIDNRVPVEKRGKAEITKNPMQPTGLLFSAIPPSADVLDRESQEKAALQLMVAATKAKMMDSIRKDPTSFVADIEENYPIEVSTVRDLKSAITLFRAMLTGPPLAEISLKPMLTPPIKKMVDDALKDPSLHLAPEERGVLVKSIEELRPRHGIHP